MIQDIYPSRLRNEYKNINISDEDFILIFDKDGKVSVKDDNGEVRFHTGADFIGKEAVYLFSIDEQKYFLLREDLPDTEEGFEYYSIRDVRDKFSGKEVYALFTAYHLNKWYKDNKFCGRCGGTLSLDEKERALRCPECGNVIYPRINPAVIVGVTKGDAILLTKYRRGYGHNALVAGFTEIGEMLEECVAREVMEETGVSVKNIRYYKSQPWGLSNALLAGYFCNVDGSDLLKIDHNELENAKWIRRDEIDLINDDISLTREMIIYFKDGNI